MHADYLLHKRKLHDIHAAKDILVCPHGAVDVLIVRFQYYLPL